MKRYAENKVVWHEGLLLRPQHFQQQERYVERFIRDRIDSMCNYPWGFERLAWDLRSGGRALGVSEAKGVFPDGTPFNLANHDLLPEPVLIESSTTNDYVVLLLPEQTSSTEELVSQRSGKWSRSRRAVAETMDINAASLGGGESEAIEVAQLSPVLALENALSTYQRSQALRVARIVQSVPSVKLDETYVPPLLKLNASDRVSGMLNDMLSLLATRADELGGLLPASRAINGLGDLVAALRLQLVNHGALGLSHFKAHGGHPEGLFRTCLSLLSDLTIFDAMSERQLNYDAFPYDHRDIARSLTAVSTLLMDILKQPIESPAVRERVIDVDERGMFTFSSVSNRARSFWLVVLFRTRPEDADITALKNQTRIGADRTIAQVIKADEPSIRLIKREKRPAELEPHFDRRTGVYPVFFELDEESGEKSWEAFRQTGHFCLKFNTDIPRDSVELWGVRKPGQPG